MTHEPEGMRSDPCNALLTVTLLDRRIRIGSVFGIGRNYAAHARELENPIPAAPVVFLKPRSALLGDGGAIVLPPESVNVQHEVEVVILLDKGGRHLSHDQGWAAIAGYGVGIDVTARDLQQKAQAAGHPWAIAKGFDTFAPVSRFIPADRIPDPRAIRFDLAVNGHLRQAGCTGDMLFDCGVIVAYLSTILTLCAGDVIFTGTPSGVGPIRSGDRLQARLRDHDVSLAVDAAAAP